MFQPRPFYLQFQKYSLLMENVLGGNLWKQMEEVQRLQERSAEYLQLYERFITQSEENQFMPEEGMCSERGMERECQKNVESGEKIEDIEFCEPSRKVTEENVEFQPRVMNLSRIFQEITLGDEVKALSTVNTLNVNLVIEGKQTPLILNRNDSSFNLSNFSSFNNQKASDNASQFDIKDLLCLIQQTTGKQLSKRGIESILSQIQLSASTLRQQQQALKDSEITQNTLFHSQINHDNLFTLEGQLFKKSKEPLALSKSTLNCREESKPKPFCKQSKFQSETRDKLNKQNTLGLHYKKRQPIVSRQIRIIKKNCLKSSLIMIYSDMKQLQNFCISNKIYGKEKQKIVKAIRENKNIVTLE